MNVVSGQALSVCVCVSLSLCLSLSLSLSVSFSTGPQSIGQGRFFPSQQTLTDTPEICLLGDSKFDQLTISIITLTYIS